MKYVLDTNIVARLLDGDERVLSRLAGVDPSDVGIPLLVLAELLFGAEKSARREQNRARVRRLTETLPMLPVGLAVVESQCDPPLAAGEVAGIVASAVRYPPSGFDARQN